MESEKQYEIKENFWENLISSKAFPWENFSGTVATLRRNVVWIFPTVVFTCSIVMEITEATFFKSGQS